MAFLMSSERWIVLAKRNVASRGYVVDMFVLTCFCGEMIQFDEHIFEWLETTKQYRI